MNRKIDREMRNMLERKRWNEGEIDRGNIEKQNEKDEVIER